MNQTTNNEAFTRQLQKLWSIESQLVDAMPRMIAKAGTLALRKNLAMHFEETRQQKVAIEAICKQMAFDPGGGEPDAALQKLLQEGEQKMMNTTHGNLEAALLEGGQKIEEHEIAAYLPAIEAARGLGYTGIAARLAKSLEEERQSATKLAFIEKELPYLLASPARA